MIGYTILVVIAVLFLYWHSSVLRGWLISFFGNFKNEQQTASPEASVENLLDGREKIRKALFEMAEQIDEYEESKRRREMMFGRSGDHWWIEEVETKEKDNE